MPSGMMSVKRVKEMFERKLTMPRAYRPHILRVIIV